MKFRINFIYLIMGNISKDKFMGWKLWKFSTRSIRGVVGKYKLINFFIPGPRVINARAFDHVTNWTIETLWYTEYFEGALGK